MGWIDSNTMELPFQTTSDTSEEAAKSIAPVASRLRELVLTFLQSCGAHGATDEEIQQGIGLAGTTQIPRRRELVLAGHVLDTGFRRPTAKGRRATVWGATAVLDPQDRGPYRSLATENKRMREVIRQLQEHLENCIIKVRGNFVCDSCDTGLDENQLLYHADGTLRCPYCQSAAVVQTPRDVI